MNKHITVRVLSVFTMISMVLGAVGIPTQTALAAPSTNALQFNGSTTQYVGFGTTGRDNLGSETFTLELWFKRTATGSVTVSTGTGGVTAYPLLTKGMGEADGDTRDCNYFLGIRSSDNVLAADFEDSTNGLNHPIAGITVLPPTENVWHHAAATYNGTKWQLFLDGKLEAELNVGKTPRANSIQYAALGTAMTSQNQNPNGAFMGILDEARVWNYARTQAEILSTMNVEIASPDPTKLLGYWKMNEGTGNLTDSSGNGVTGTITGATWAGAGFDINVDVTAPATTTGLSVTAGNKLATLIWTANAEADLRGYNIYRSTSTPVPTDIPINGSNFITSNRYVDGSLTNGTIYHYAVTAVDSTGNESGASTEVSATPASAAGYAMQFNGTNQYVTFGRASKLGVETFTIEGWFKRTGTGVTADTGGVVAEPLITKGRGESDNSNVDMNYFIGIRPADGFLVADFEDGANGANHPIVGTSSVLDGAWHHVALAYEPSGTNMLLKLYLDGSLQNTVTVTKLLPRADSIQHAALGTALNSTGVASGYFNGLIDEVRIWDYARTQTEINTNKSVEILAAPGLLGRWGLNEGSEAQVNDTSGRGVNGTATNNPTWATDTPFGTPPAPPAAPTGLNATSSNYFAVNLTWTDNSNNETGFEIERSTSGSGGPFSLLTTAAANAVSYSDNNVQAGAGYCYQVRAVNGAGQSAYTSISCATTTAEPSSALNFDGTNDYITFGAAPGLGVTNFTLETWFYWTGGGVATTTSTTQGLLSVIPLVSKGRGEADGDNRDMNYFIGIDTATTALAVDFEDMASGMNYPFITATPVTTNTWHHAAVTYDSTNAVFNVYLDGNLVGTKDNGSNILPRWDSIQHAGLGTAMTSSGAAAGYFQGVMDEVRIWNVVKLQGEIRSTINQQIYSGTGLVARWGMGEGSGTTIASSIGSFPGTLTNGPTFVAGAPFNLSFDTEPPAAPTGLFAVGANSSAALDWNDNTDTDLAGYNVYRGTAPGVYAKVNTNIVATSAYSDTGLTNGTEYYYVVRAVDTSGNVSTDSNEAYVIPQLEAGSALAFTSDSGTYVTFGDPAKLDLPTFTIETWFKRTGTGTAITTGGGGIANAIPLVAHGAQQSEGGTVDANWMLVIDDATDTIAADFEDMASGANHPVYGFTPILDNTWHHAAATYDGSSWKLYLDGKLETTLTVGAAPRSDTTQHASLGTMLNTTGGTNGFFRGVLDEARVWNRALTQTEIITNINHQVINGSGLVARWGLNEGTGSVVNDSIPTVANGTITGSNFAWVPGAPFDLNLTPETPTLVSPADAATGVTVPAQLTVHVSDTQNSDLTVSFYGREMGASGGEDFTLIAIPDPQYYAQAANNDIYNAQMNWVVNNKIARNIKFAMSLGDNVNTSTTISEWAAATAAWDILTSGSMPYGLVSGNHDGAPSSTGNFNTYFGSRISGQPTYGGRYGTSDYDNTYSTFSASGMDFIVLFIEMDDGMTSTSNPVLVWADGVLTANPSRRAIVVTHNLLSGNNLSTQGQAIYDVLKDQPNLFLMLGGHLDETGQNSFVYEGRTVYALRSDYQFVDSQRSGYLRIMRFSPADDMIYVTTYSPNQNLYRTINNNAFNLAYNMDGAAPFSLIGSTSVPSGSDATVTWSGLTNNKAYEWYAVADNGGAAAVSPTWNFTTEATTNTSPVLDPIGDQNVNEGTLLTFTASATDTDTLTFSLDAGAPSGVAINGNTGIFTWTPTESQGPGSYPVTVRVSDGSLADFETITITVNEVNQNPNVTDPGAQTNLEGTVVSLQINASDADLPANTLAYAASNLPLGLGIDPASGLISGTIDNDAAASSPYSVTVTVTDGVGGSTQVNLTWTIGDVTPPPSGLTCTTLNPKPGLAEYDGSGHKPQSRVWQYDDTWWSVFSTNASGASSAGTWLWKLEGTTWTEVQKLSDSTNLKLDVKPLGDMAYVLLFSGTAPTSAKLAAVQFSGGTYGTPVVSDMFTMSGATEIATLDIDSTGRMWTATSNSGNGVRVYYSDSPYTTWSAPVILAGTGVWDDDMTSIVAMPGVNKVGVLWGNQSERVFRFFVHDDGADPATWATETPPYNPDWQNLGSGSPTYGVADDHINLKAASDGTVYAAVKTSYDTAGYPKMALYVRHADGSWDDLHGVDESGTRPNVLVDEVHGYLTYIYSSSEGYNNIVYRQSTTQNINFTSRTTLRAGSFNDVTGMKAGYTDEFVVLYHSSSEVAGQICSPIPVSGADLSITKTDGVLTVRPNDALTYTITVTNNGPEAANGATVTDTLPSALTNVSWTCSASGGASCAASGVGNISDTVDLPAGGSVTYSLSAKVDLGARGVLNNTAQVAPPVGLTDPNTTDNTATDSDTIIAEGSSCGSDPTLVGCWQMEENGGPALIDGSSYLNDGALNGFPVWVAGKVGNYALDLNGTSQYAVVADDASLDITNQITVAAWIKPEQYATQDIVKKATNGSVNGYELSLATTKGTPENPDPSSQRPFFRINQAASSDTYRVNAVTMYPTDGTWMHVAGTFDGTTLRIYINGVLENSIDASGQTIALNDLPLTIGAQDGAIASRWFMGWMDEARVYNRAMTLTEIQALAGVTPPACYTLITDVLPADSGKVTTPVQNCEGGFTEGTVVELTPEPYAGYHFVDWSNGTSGTNNPLLVTMDADKTITANFAINTFTLAYTAGTGGSLTGSTSQTVNYGSNGTAVTAVPNTGYQFVDWSDGVLTATRTDTNVMANLNVIANFSILSTPVTVTVTDANGKAQSGVTVYLYNGSTYLNVSKTTDANGHVTFPLYAGSYRFRILMNGTSYWSGPSNTCILPGCSSDSIVMPALVTVTAADGNGVAQAGVTVYLYNGSTYADAYKTTDANGHVTFLLYAGSYRFRVITNGTSYWSGPSNTCTLPGCSSDTVVVNP